MDEKFSECMYVSYVSRSYVCNVPWTARVGQR